KFAPRHHKKRRRLGWKSAEYATLCRPTGRRGSMGTVLQRGSDMADKIRLGLIGASVRGTWSSRSHLPALRASADVELTAVCTTRADSAEAARQAYGARLAFDDWRKLVASPEIDAVAVVVRVPSHYEPTKAALEAGKHVYCEWPLGRTTAEAEELAALAKAKGV